MLTQWVCAPLTPVYLIGLQILLSIISPTLTFSDEYHHDVKTAFIPSYICPPVVVGVPDDCRILLEMDSLTDLNQAYWLGLPGKRLENSRSQDEPSGILI